MKDKSEFFSKLSTETVPTAQKKAVNSEVAGSNIWSKEQSFKLLNKAEFGLSCDDWGEKKKKVG